VVQAQSGLTWAILCACPVRAAGFRSPDHGRSPRSSSLSRLDLELFVLMDNKTIATIFYETADLMEVAAEDSFSHTFLSAAPLKRWRPCRSRSRRFIRMKRRCWPFPGSARAWPDTSVKSLPRGKLSTHEQLLKKYQPAMLELLKISGLGAEDHCADLGQLSTSATWKASTSWPVKASCAPCPRLSEKSEQKIIKAIESYRHMTGRFSD